MGVLLTFVFLVSIVNVSVVFTDGLVDVWSYFRGSSKVMLMDQMLFVVM